MSKQSISKRLKVFYLKKLLISKIKGVPIDADEIAREFVLKEYRKDKNERKKS